MKSFYIKACLVIFLIESVGIYFIKESFLGTMTNNEEILEAARPILPLLVVNSFMEMVKSGLIRGILKAMNL